MKRLKITLFALALLLLVSAGIGIWLIRKNTFRLAEWDYPQTTSSSNNNPAQPNILLLVAEDMSALVSAFGDKVAHTPNIDQLAKIGVRYPNTFTTAGVCSPSRAALITGMHQISIGGQHMRTATRPEGAYLTVPPPQVKAFPELLRKAGYFTFNTTKQDYQFSGAFPGSGPFTIWNEENNQNLWRNRQQGQPFFGMMNFMETHESGVFTPLGYRPSSLMHFILQVVRKFGGWQKKTVSIDPATIDLPPYYPNTPTIRNDVARHYENVATMDAQIGNIFQKLKKDKLLESTIIIWTTDHGNGLPRAKRELYDSGIKVPMIIYFPPAFRPKNMEEGIIDEQLISFIDLAPTILTLAKAPIPQFIQGQNFLQDTLKRSFVYASRDRIDEVRDRQRAVRNHRFKYIKSWYPEQAGGHHLAFRDNLEMMQEFWKLKAENKLNQAQLLWFQSPKKERLFDIKNDPFELNNLSQDTAYSTQLITMRNALEYRLSTIVDWSKQTENDMVAGFQPNGQIEKTPAPTINYEGNFLKISAANNASIGYKINDGNWQLYSQPINISNARLIKAKAIRYGWEESDQTIFNAK